MSKYRYFMRHTTPRWVRLLLFAAGLVLGHVAARVFLLAVR